MQLSTKQKKANTAMKLAVAATKRKLAPKARKKTVTTYPKGEWDETLKKELKIAARNQGLKPSKPKAASDKAVKKSKSKVKRKKTMAPKYPTLGAAKSKKATTKKKSTAKKKSPAKPKGLVAKIKSVFK